ncbi:MAG: hypothetical protein H8Z69_03225 [Nanohaloarchaea archaeon]|nr:hypothetical protein [Candidatus Nanohaloarchaea archaeon]
MSAMPPLNLQQNGEWDHLEQAEDVTGLNFTDAFDSVKRTRLPENVPAATRTKYGLKGAKTELQLDYDIEKTLSESEILNASIHEGLHGLDHKGMLDEELESIGVDPEVSNRIDRLTDGPLEVEEGTIQAVSNALDPNGGSNYAYPYETQMVEDYLEQEGIDLESELAEDIQDTKMDLVDDYREVYARFSTDNLYFEAGSIGDHEYGVIAFGDNAEIYGEEMADNFVEDIAESYGIEAEGYSPEEQEYKEELLDGSVSMEDSETLGLQPAEV